MNQKSGFVNFFLTCFQTICPDLFQTFHIFVLSPVFSPVIFVFDLNISLNFLSDLRWLRWNIELY